MQGKFGILFCSVLLAFSCKEADNGNFAGTELFQLAPPKIAIDSVLFSKEAKVEVYFEVEGSTIRYTDDGSDVSGTSPVYTKPISVTKSSQLKFKSFHPEFKESPEIPVSLTKIRKNVSDARITLNTGPHPNYPGNGASSLVDLKKGNAQFSDGKHWMGFQDNEVRIQMDLEKEMSVSKLIISTLKDHDSWIFLPRTVRIISGSKAVGEVKLNTPLEMEPKQMEYIEIPIPEDSYKHIEIQIDLEATIPEWHQGRGTKPFFFIDEILVE